MPNYGGYNTLFLSHEKVFKWETGLELMAMSPVAICIRLTDLAGESRESIIRLTPPDCAIGNTSGSLNILLVRGNSLRLEKTLDVIIRSPDEEPVRFETLREADFDY